MKLELKCYEYLCALELFKINDIEAYYEDFGIKEDISPETAEEYSCGNMQFMRKNATKEVLDKYHITIEEYEEICDKLDCLSFGCCGWCV